MNYIPAHLHAVFCVCVQRLQAVSRGGPGVTAKGVSGPLVQARNKPPPPGERWQGFACEEGEEGVGSGMHQNMLSFRGVGGV